MPTVICRAFALLSAVSILINAHSSIAQEGDIDFARDIKPIFAAHCLACHGPQNQEGGLRLHQRSAAMRGGDSGAVIVPKRIDKSELIRRVTSDDELERMPPADADVKPLSAEQIGRLSKWIAQGAKWPDDGPLQVASDHWSFQPVRRAELPDVTNRDWPRNEIDYFILARLEAAGIKPSPDADRYTLMRRLYYDLIGLPPTPEEVDAFVGDSSPDAYEKLVDRLLESPHFGERWGRHWLDKARYADSDGYEKDRPRPNAWRYREWVIDAINDDMPFDQFTIEQLAGDLLPNATPMQKLATAFHRQTLTNTEGGTDQEQFRVEAIFDRVSTTGTVWMGLTIGCAQCHSHKYDPISQAEFYQLFAFYNNGDETSTQVPISDEEVAEYHRQKAEFDLQLTELKQKRERRRNELARALASEQTIERLRKQVRAALEDRVEFHPVEIVSIAATGSVELEPQQDGSILAAGANPTSSTYTIIAKTDQTKPTGFRLEVFADDRLPSKGPGRVAHGNFVLSEFRAAVDEDESFADAKLIDWKTATADHSQNGWPVAAAIDGKAETGWAVAPQYGQNHRADFVINSPVHTGEGSWLRFELDQQYGKQHTIGRFRLSVRTGSQIGEEIPDAVQQAIAIDHQQWNSAQRNAMVNFYAELDERYRKLNEQITKLEKSAPKPPMMSVRVISQRKNDPRQTHILRRGDFLQPLDEVQPGTLAVLPPLKPRSSKSMADRLDLARWLVDSRNPLTPRVVANQIWSHLIGQGLVDTMNDFGVRGDRPTHPELLNWLASEFVRLKWSRKQFIKTIVMSATYRQSSRHRPELVEVDPQNDLLSRQNRFRVEAEIVRDLHLAASGLLSTKIGGPSVFPPMPPDIAALSYANNFKWTPSQSEDRYRRGMYTFFKRTAPHPNLTTFDCPDSNTTTVDRRTSNTPLMALTTLNNIVFTEAAQAMARRVLNEEHPTDSERITRIFRLCVARFPTETERVQFQDLLDTARKWYGEHPEEAKTFIGNYRAEHASEAESAAWTVVARIIMNADEFITRE